MGILRTTEFYQRNPLPDAERVQGRGIIREVKGQLGCRRFHTHDTCIWQVDPMHAIAYCLEEHD